MYKRQIQSTTDRREHHLRPTQKYIDYYNISYSYPVSYTHLEVPVAKARNTATRKMMNGSRYCKAAAEPVSYTHLDVYKRQPHQNAVFL